MSKAIKASVTEAFYNQVHAYATHRGITDSAALVEFARVGCQAITGELPAEAMKQHGGDRKSEKYQQYLQWVMRMTANGNDYDPAADQDGDYSYAAWLAKQP